jgi:hypothetical protein
LSDTPLGNRQKYDELIIFPTSEEFLNAVIKFSLYIVVDWFCYLTDGAQ